jgi:hypothetical protein
MCRTSGTPRSPISAKTRPSSSWAQRRISGRTNRRGGCSELRVRALSFLTGSHSLPIRPVTSDARPGLSCRARDWGKVHRVQCKGAFQTYSTLPTPLNTRFPFNTRSQPPRPAPAYPTSSTLPSEKACVAGGERSSSGSGVKSYNTPSPLSLSPFSPVPLLFAHAYRTYILAYPIFTYSIPSPQGLHTCIAYHVHRHHPRTHPLIH